MAEPNFVGLVGNLSLALDFFIFLFLNFKNDDSDSGSAHKWMEPGIQLWVQILHQASKSMMILTLQTKYSA
jgi:hypothetical protein